MTRQDYFEISAATAEQLRHYADEYEKKDFIVGDPSWFMHQVAEPADQEVMGFIASSISYGSRKVFMPRIQFLLDASEGHPHEWVASGKFHEAVADDDRCFYRLYTNHDMRIFLDALSEMIVEYGSIKNFVAKQRDGMHTAKLQAIDAVEALCRFFAERGIQGIIPKNAQSSCKRVCMFLRWMVRDGSPVDLGLWSDIIDRRSLIIPLDTHVLTEANKLGLIATRTTSMSTALRLSQRLAQVFPDDPTKGDFALFGYGVNH